MPDDHHVTVKLIRVPESSRSVLPLWLGVFAAVFVAALSSCGSTTEPEPAGDVVEIEYSNSSSESIVFDIVRVDWTDDSVLESASFLDGGDLEISGTSPAQGSIGVTIPAQSTDWLQLTFDSVDPPDGLTVTIVTSRGATLTHVYGSAD